MKYIKIMFNGGIVWWRWLVFGFIEEARPSFPAQGRSCTIETHEIELILGVILLYYTFKVLSNLFIKQPEDIRLDEDHLIVETRWGIKDFILD